MKEVVSFLNLCPILFNAHDKKQGVSIFSTYDERHATRFKTYSTSNVLVSYKCASYFCIPVVSVVTRFIALCSVIFQIFRSRSDS